MAQEAANAAGKDRLYTYAMAGGALLAVILTLVVLFLRRRRSAQRVIEEEVEEEPVPVAAMEMERKQKVSDDKQTKIRGMAEEKPAEVAEILKVWLKD
jgi:flagellar M-ring protein FliF